MPGRSTGASVLPCATVVTSKAGTRCCLIRTVLREPKGGGKREAFLKNVTGIRLLGQRCLLCVRSASLPGDAAVCKSITRASVSLPPSVGLKVAKADRASLIKLSLIMLLACYWLRHIVEKDGVVLKTEAELLSCLQLYCSTGTVPDSSQRQV